MLNREPGTERHDIGDTLKRFPKERPPLSPRLSEVYAEHYKSNRRGDTPASSVSQKMEAWMHRRIAEDVVGRAGSNTATLELGAGNLNQLSYEPESGPYDAIEPFTDLYAGSPALARVRNVWSDMADVPAGERYDRITSVAVLEHICNLPEVVASSGLHLAEGGTFRAAIPSDGTPLWTLGWRMTTGLEFGLRYRLDYGELMRHEHVNTAREIDEILVHFFADVDCRTFGPSKTWSLYRMYVCRRPAEDRCRQYLESLREGVRPVGA